MPQVPTPVLPPTSQPANTQSPSAPSGFVQAKVVRVVDGDTIEVEIDSKRSTVRYIGVDTPETVDPRRPVQAYGKEATAKNKELVEGKTVTLEKDVSETDRYGRLLRYVYVGEIMVNSELVRLGYAQASAYPPDVKYQERFRELEKEARENKRGLWAQEAPQAPATARPAATPSRVTPTPVTSTPAPSGFDASRFIGQGDKYNCPDFTSQAQAQAVLRADQQDPNRLDGDRNGIACESNPAPYDRTSVPR